MKTISIVLLLSVCSLIRAQSLSQAAIAGNPSLVTYFIGQRDANSQVWHKIVQTTNAQGNVVYQTNQAYVELATGLNYKDAATGSWLPSQEEIDGYPGGAIAQYGQHKVVFANNLNTAGAIDLQTPDGKELQSEILGLSYYDTVSGQSVLIAQVQDSQGQIVSSNQVVYPNAFQGVSADVRYCYTRAGLEQDVILLTQLPRPELFGLSATSCVLQVLTEFTAAPAPVIQASPSVANDALADEMLDFGAMKMVRGRAFLLGTNSPAVLISKQWLNVGRRTVLVESMPLTSITKSLSKLPAFSATSLNRHPGSVQYLVSNQRLLPSPRTAATMKTEMKLALSDAPARGFDLDLIFVNSSSNPYTFAGDNTYWVTGPVNFSSDVTFEGGSVIKYSQNAYLNINDPGQIICNGAPYRPTVFTSKDDNSVGTAIGTGIPSGWYANPAIAFIGSNHGASSMTLHHFRIAYAMQAIYASGLSVNAVVEDGQIVDCSTGFSSPGQTGASFANVLFANVLNPFQLGIASVQVYNSTFGHLSTDLSPLAVGEAGVEGSAFLTLENCILANINTYSTNMSHLVTGDHNGFYNSGAGSQSQYGGTTFGTSPIRALGPPFYQGSGSGSYYLASGCGFFNKGTANIDPVLLADLKTRTTYPPQVLTSDFTGNNTLTPNTYVVRDNSSSPDLGYHYAPLDYCLSGLSAGTTLTLTDGVAIGIYGSSGLSVGGQLISQGTPTNHNQLVYYSLVQEQPSAWGAHPFNNLFSSLNQARLRFTDICMAAGQTWNFSPNVDGGGITLVDCQLQTAFFNMAGMNWGGMAFTNNIFARCNLVFNDVAGGYSLNFYNNLFLGGTLSLNLYNLNWNVYDNLFNSANFHIWNYVPNHGFNAYYNAAIPYDPHTGYTTPGNQALTTLDFQAGALGSYYYPKTGNGLNLLRNAGSTTADERGLYHYTVTTDQVVEGDNTVSIGYHYVAVDQNGNPFDSNEDGIPDYLSDANGNGVDDPGETPWDIYIVESPRSQTVVEGDTVTFSVVAIGSGTLTYQWTRNGVPISGATGSSYTINSVQADDAASYAVIVSNENNSVTTEGAQLTPDSVNPLCPSVEYATEDFNIMVAIEGPRQNYTFKSGYTYYISSRVQLYGTTTIEAGAVLKFDWYYPSTLQVMGPLICGTNQYNPAILTSVDDDANGTYLFAVSLDFPQPAANGVPYLDLSATSSNSVRNLRICFADKGIATPSGRLDVWDCQFYTNNTAINANPGATVSLHNVLIACKSGTAVGATTSFNEIDAEQLTADVATFWSGPLAPAHINLVNSIIMGTLTSGPIISIDSVAINPPQPVFQSLHYGHYYLAGPTYRGNGEQNITPELISELHNKTTYPPVALPFYMQVSGNITLAPQVSRYSGGRPDYGYYYPAMDYTVAWTTLTDRGSITMEPGTVVAVGNGPYEYEGFLNYNRIGFDMLAGSSFFSHGTPNKPNIFTAEKLVQEVPETDYSIDELFAYCYVYYGPIWVGVMTFVPDFNNNDAKLPAPTLDFRFSEFYLPLDDYHIASGMDETGFWALWSWASSVYLKMQDCSLHGGKVDLGNPDQDSPGTIYAPGAVTWVNNLFDNVSVNLDPTDYEYIYLQSHVVNCDMQVQVYNNLFRGGQWFHLKPITKSADNWIFEDNLFDRVDFLQDAHLPLDFDYNAYWELTAPELTMDWDFSPCNLVGVEPYLGLINGSTAQLQTTTTGTTFTDGGHEAVLLAPPPYQPGPLGNYYMQPGTPLYNAGSRSPADAGLAQYTTRFDQSKELGKSQVDIGLHYVATAGSTTTTPKDTDGNGIPDYVADANGNGVWDQTTETDWQNGSASDAYSAIYDDVDLSGDGLVGRVKKALGINPLDSSNPLTLKQVITGEEPDIATFEVPIDYNLLTSVGSLHLNVDGADATLEECDRAPSGTCYLKWNTDYDSPVQHTLQVFLSLQQVADETVQNFGIGYGSLILFNSPNVAQFYEASAGFNSAGTTLLATTPACLNATYTIKLYDPSMSPRTLITTIGPHTTSTGVIQENWNGQYANGAAFTGNQVDAEFDIALQDPGSATQTQRLNLWSFPGDGNFDVAYADDCNEQLQGQGGVFWTAMQDVVITLIDNIYALHDYNSTFDVPFGYPGYLQNRTSALGLKANLANASTENLYFFGHGNINAIGAGYSDPNSAYLKADEVADALNNHASVDGGIIPGHPYRFVFLDSCSTAKTKDWQRAFGIITPPGPSPYLDPNPPRAFLGWEGVKSGPYPPGGCNEETFTDYGTTLNVFFDMWMNGYTLDECIRGACANYSPQTPSGLHYPLPIPANSHGTYSNGSRWSNPYLVHLKLVGYAGLTRDNYVPGYPIGTIEY